MAPFLIHQVTPEEDGMLLRTVLRQQLQLSAGTVRRAKQLPDGILLDRVPVFVSVRVHTGQQIQIRLNGESGSSSVLPVPGPLDLRYEDEHLLVIYKPAGLCVHPSPGHFEESLANYLRYAYSSEESFFIPRIVNRLDRGTSGLLIVARHAQAQATLSQQIRCGTYRRTYFAITLGVPQPAEGTIRLPIGRAPDSVLRRQVISQGTAAVTHYQVLAQSAHGALVQLQLKTGKTHQIRVHMQALGTPLAGDFLYGTEDPSLISHTALHAGRLCFYHPIHGEKLFFSAPPPPEFFSCMDQLGITPPPGIFSGLPFRPEGGAVPY